MCSANAYSPSASHCRTRMRVVADRVVLVLEIELEHFLGLLRRLDRFRSHRGHAAEIIDLLGDEQGMLQLLARVRLQLLGNVHVLGPLEDLRVDHIGDDRLILPGKILVERRESTARA